MRDSSVVQNCKLLWLHHFVFVVGCYGYEISIFVMQLGGCHVSCWLLWLHIFSSCHGNEFIMLSITCPFYNSSFSRHPSSHFRHTATDIVLPHIIHYSSRDCREYYSRIITFKKEYRWTISRKWSEIDITESRLGWCSCRWLRQTN